VQLSFDLMMQVGWDIEADMLWGYRFLDSDKAKLQRLARHLESLSYRGAKISRPDGEDEPSGYLLYVEKIEKHSSATMLQGNEEFRALAVTFDIESYKGWVVRKVK
jgi:regulator of ribonuclease activity B